MLKKRLDTAVKPASAEIQSWTIARCLQCKEKSVYVCNISWSSDTQSIDPSSKLGALLQHHSDTFCLCCVMSEESFQSEQSEQ